MHIFTISKNPLRKMAHSKKLIRIICITSEYILESEIVKEAPVSEL